MKTHDELERDAYIHGDIIIAELYGKIDDADYSYDEFDRMSEGIRDLQDEIDYLSVQNMELEEDVEFWRKRAIEAEGKLEETQFILESLSK
jgi:hypothetical protein